MKLVSRNNLCTHYTYNDYLFIASIFHYTEFSSKAIIAIEATQGSAVKENLYRDIISKNISLSSEGAAVNYVQINKSCNWCMYKTGQYLRYRTRDNESKRLAKDLVIDYKYIRGTTSTSCVDFHCQSLNHHIMKTLYIFVTYKITMWQFWVFRTPEKLCIYHWTCVPSVLKSTSFVPRCKQAYSLLECYFVVLTFAQHNSTRFLIAQCCFNSPNIRIDCKL